MHNELRVFTLSTVRFTGYPPHVTAGHDEVAKMIQDRYITALQFNRAPIPGISHVAVGEHQPSKIVGLPSAIRKSALTDRILPAAVRQRHPPTSHSTNRFLRRGYLLVSIDRSSRKRCLRVGRR